MCDGLYHCIIYQVSLGTVTTIDEAVQWLSYSFLFVRMLLNPLVYGIPHHAREVRMGLIMWVGIHVCMYKLDAISFNSVSFL